MRAEEINRAIDGMVAARQQTFLVTDEKISNIIEELHRLTGFSRFSLGEVVERALGIHLEEGRVLGQEGRVEKLEVGGVLREFQERLRDLQMRSKGEVFNLLSDLNARINEVRGKLVTFKPGAFGRAILGSEADPAEPLILQAMGVTAGMKRDVRNSLRILINELRTIGREVCGPVIKEGEADGALVLEAIRSNPAKAGLSCAGIAEMEWLLVRWHDGNWAEANAWLKGVLPEFRQ